MLDCSELKNVLFRSLAAECYWVGDLYEREEKFFRFVECRDENTSCIIARIQNKDMENGK